jgi:hypothetical protein
MAIDSRYPHRTLPLVCLLLFVALDVFSSPQDECELFIAESTIPHAGLGAFSAVEKKPGDVIGTGDLAFPMIHEGWGRDINRLDPLEVRCHIIKRRSTNTDLTVRACCLQGLCVGWKRNGYGTRIS